MDMAAAGGHRAVERASNMIAANQIKWRLLRLLLLLFALVAQSQQDGDLGQQDDELSAEFDRSEIERASSQVESWFGQVAKGVVYGGATLARLNSRLLCGLLTHETHLNNTEEPVLYAFGGHLDTEEAFRIYASDEISHSLLDAARLDPNQMTYLLVHGWLGGLYKEVWLQAAKERILGARSQHFRPQVLVVDWSELASGSLYEATENSKRVSVRLAHLLRQLHSVVGLKPDLMHCLGHSIGAHICGRAARDAFAHNETKLGRITALDPGGFCYELGIKNETTFEGMRPSDARLVDAYYSNRSPFGNKHQAAHYNVRLNNGFLQRACSAWLQPQVGANYFRAAVKFLFGRRSQADSERLTCDHYFATKIGAQKPPPHCAYVGYACPSYARFLRGQCGLCRSPAHCYPMAGEYQLAEPSAQHHLAHLRAYESYLRSPETREVAYSARRPYYLQTSAHEPHCSLLYRLRLRLGDQVPLANFRADWLQVQLIGSREEVMRVRLAATGRQTESLRLYGPWSSPSLENEEPEVGAARLELLYGLDNRTFTSLLELLPDTVLHQSPDGGRLLQAPVHDLVVLYDNAEAARRNPALESLSAPLMIDYVQLDYLSSADGRERQRLSLRRDSFNVRIIYKRLLAEADRQTDSL